MEGERIHLRLQNGENKKGIITQLRGETIFINGEPIVKHSIAAVVVNYKTQKPFPADFKTMLLIGGGVGLTTIGLSLNDANPPKTALIAAATIGYAPILLKHFGSRLLNIVKRTKYQIGHKFRLQVFDLYLPRQRPF